MRQHTALHLHDSDSPALPVPTPRAPAASAGRWRRLAAGLASGATIAAVATLSSAAASTPVAPSSRTARGPFPGRFRPHVALLRPAAEASRHLGSAALRPALVALVATRPETAGGARPGGYSSWAVAAMHLSLRRLDAAPPAGEGSATRHLHRFLHRRALGLSDGVSPATWLALRECESGDNYQADTGNGYYGAYQFSASTWWEIGFSGLPSTAPQPVQDEAAKVLLARQGWGAWPVCSVRLGLY